MTRLKEISITEQADDRDKLGVSRIWIDGDELILTNILWECGSTTRTYEKDPHLKRRSLYRELVK